MLEKIEEFIIHRILREDPRNLSEAQNRTIARYRKVALAGIGGVFARGIGWISNFLLVPLTLSYLGNERYGFYVTLNSLITFLSFSDLGIGNGIINAISKADGADDRTMAQRYVSSGFFFLTGLSLLLILLFLSIYPFVDWQNLLNTASSMGSSETGPAILIFIICYFINIPLGLAQRILLGYQEGFLTNLWIGISGLMTFFAIFLGIKLKLGVPGLVLAAAGTPILVSLATNVFLFVWHKPWLKPQLSLMGQEATNFILKTGGLYFILQLAGALTNGSSNIIILKMLNANQVTQFSIPQKLYQFIPTIISFFLTPLWPAYGEAIQRGDHSWVKKTFLRSIGLGALINLPLTSLLLIYSYPTLHWWAGSTVNPSKFYLLMLAISNLLNILSGPIAMLLNGSGVIKFQVYTSLTMGVATVVLSILFIPVMGYAGALVATMIATVLCTILPSLFYIMRMPYFKAALHNGEL